MDNKITKKRLSDFLSYEWILLIVVAIISIAFWEIAYTAGAVRLTPGQQFKYFYDQSILPENDDELIFQLVRFDTFSYEVQQLGGEVLVSENNLLKTRLSIDDGDVIFTDIVGNDQFEDEEQTIPKAVRAKSLIDNTDIKIYSLEKMLVDARAYISNFIKDGQQMQEESIDDAKLKAMFLKRNKKDNRFRKDYEIEQGLQLEKQRIIKLIDNVEFLQSFINNPANEKALFRYTRFEQSYNISNKSEHYKILMDKEQAEGRANDVYGINICELVGGVDVAEIMNLRQTSGDNKEAKDIVVMTFDFSSKDPDLQYESLAFICSTIKMFTEPTQQG